MNKIVVTIKNIQSLNELNLVEFSFEDVVLNMVSLELPSRVKIGQKVALSMKSTQINIAKDFQGELSFSNQIKAKVANIEKGEILSSVILQKSGFLFESIITSNSLDKMGLKIDDEVLMLIKANDISILEFYND